MDGYCNCADGFNSRISGEHSASALYDVLCLRWLCVWTRNTMRPCRFSFLYFLAVDKSNIIAVPRCANIFQLVWLICASRTKLPRLLIDTNWLWSDFLLANIHSSLIFAVVTVRVQVVVIPSIQFSFFTAITPCEPCPLWAFFIAWK